MQPYVITPWREASELLLVRSQLYRLGDSKLVDQRREAINKVGAWKIRGNLPHAVESTALLVDAILHHDVSKNSTFSIRAVYSAAFCRFVTVLCDAGKSGMYAVASRIGMPASFVELRHEATHEELPSLQRLERNVQASIDWLWYFYWKELDIESPGPSTFSLGRPSEPAKSTISKEEVKTRNELQNALKSYLVLRKTEIKSSGTWLKTKSPHADPSCRNCVRTCRGNPASLSMLSSILVEENFIFPMDKQNTTPVSMTGAFAIWNPLLLQLQVHLHSSFLRDLIITLLTSLKSLSEKSVALDARRDAIYQWIIHILTSKEWGGSPRLIRIQDELKITLMKICLMELGYWTRKVARGVVEASGDDFKRAWGPLFNKAVPAGNEAYGQPSQTISGRRGSTDVISIPDAVSTSNNRIGSANQGSSEIHEAKGQEHERRGWSKWEGLWKPKPIGVIDA